MKVLWLCNVLLPVISDDLGLPSVVYGGWLSGALHSISNMDAKENIEIAVCCPLPSSGSIITGEINKIKYFCFPNSKKRTGYDKGLKSYFEQILLEFRPDLLHIFGTEYVHALAATKAFGKPEQTLVHIQGLCSECAKYYFFELPPMVCFCPTPRDIYLHDTLVKQKRMFFLRGRNEIELLKYAGHVSGRTDWDYASVTQINPSIKYHFCNETLRKGFYNGNWSPNKCEKHSIFASSAAYPIKGFHLLLKALPIILKRFTDAKVYVTGRSPLNIPTYKLSGYNKYLKKLIVDNGLQDNVVFCGILDEQQMKERFLRSNVFVLASSIENSPNSLGEAMLLGVPCVASDVGGVKSMMTHENEGFVYQQNSSSMLAHYVCEIFRNDVLALSFSKKAQAHARKTHDPDINAQTLMNIYSNIMTRGNE